MDGAVLERLTNDHGRGQVALDTGCLVLRQYSNPQHWTPLHQELFGPFCEHAVKHSTTASPTAVGDMLAPLQSSLSWGHIGKPQ